MERGKQNRMSMLRTFLLSPFGFFVQFVAAALILVFHLEYQGAFVFLGIFCAVLCVSDNICASTLPFLLACVFLAKCGNSYDVFMPYWWVIIFPFGALLYHLVKFRKPIQRGKAFWGIFAASVAVTIGGLGTITAKEYFAGGALFHVAALGFGMLLAYVILYTYIEAPKGQNMITFFSNMMFTLGLFAAFMVAHHYLVFLPAVLEKREILAFQWRNNVSSILMLCLPFPFFLALKNPWKLLAGLAIFAAMLLTGSRGALLFGTIEFVMCIIYLLWADKKRRIAYAIIVVIAIGVLALLFRDLILLIKPTIIRLITLLFSTETEARVALYARAIEDFKNHPIFGVGLGYMGNRDVHPSKDFALCWYHNAPLQVLASLGLVGVAAYLLQMIARVRIFLKTRSAFHGALFIAFLGIEMMSLVNPGVFAPLPYLLLVTIFLVIAEKTQVEKSAPQAAVPLAKELENQT
ncbi:MAG: O-antigen ligase family protein [Oscillospiraceae bacterium]|nr:O-antigen ligase family protein [Oscillospiraceae bacterium]